MARKTVELVNLKKWANEFLKNSEDGLSQQRLGVASLLEAALHSCAAYKGYRYLEPSDMENSALGTSVGLVFSENGDVNFDDMTRRFYY